jgi:Ni/Co efflux regulator RcnB
MPDARMHRRAVVALLAVAFFAAPALAQDAPATTKSCETAKRKIEREQKSLAAATDSMVRDQRARQTCASRSVCARYDSAIAGTDKRRWRHEARLARFKEEAAAACAAP